MKTPLTILLIVCVFLISTITASFAGSRYYRSGYGSHHYSGSFSHYRPYYRGHGHHSDRVWAHLGIGLLSGAVIGSLLYQPTRQRTIVYQNPPPVIVYPNPVVFSPQYSPIYSQPQVVLRRVKTTPKILNVRTDPGLYGEIAAQIIQNTILDVLGAAPDWLFIKTRTGQYGWIMTKYTREAEGPVG